MLKGRLLPILAAMTMAVAAPAFAADPSATNGVIPGTTTVAAIESFERPARETAVPRVLSATDEAYYRQARELIAQNQFAQADRVLEHVSDPLLAGHMQAEQMLVSGAHTNFERFRAWMTKNAALPEAELVYERARQELGARVKQIATPTAAYESGSYQPHDQDVTWEHFALDDTPRGLAKADFRKLEQIKDRFRAKVKDGDFPAAADMLQTAEARRLLAPADANELQAVLALGLFDNGQDLAALPFAQAAAAGSGDLMPETHWLSGLLLWRLKRQAESVTQFEAVANAQDVSGWMVAAGAYWAARANLAAHKPELVNHWLQKAASYPRTLYGMLARRALGFDMDYSWVARPFTDTDADVLSRIPATRRALALIQIGDMSGAQDELRHVVPNATLAMSRAMLALAHVTGMPDLAINLSNAVAAQDGRFHDTTDYPLPRWRPSEGWSVDRALVFAIVRQESGFNPNAKSPAGAVGLMQLLPSTAKIMGSGKAKMTDPAANLTIGQRYVTHLLTSQNIGGNLLLMVASYNSGPGNVTRWQQQYNTGDDALLFLESIPSHETRAFVEQVLTNFWAYRDRLGEHSSSIDALAAGSWPIYDEPASGFQAARNDED